MRWKRVDNTKENVVKEHNKNLIPHTKKSFIEIIKEKLRNFQEKIKNKINKPIEGKKEKAKASFYNFDSNIERKLNKKKVIVLGITVITVVTIITGTIIIISSNIEKEKEAYRIEMQRIRDEEIAKAKEEEEKEAARQAKLPKLTEQGIENMKNIYFADRRRVFLTFDDGPSTNTTAILDILKQENVKATFFELGTRVEAMPELVKRTYDEGHYIASHGYSHVYSQIYSTPQSVLDEYNQSVQLIRNAIGESEYSPHLFRFPGGLPGGKFAEIKAQAAQLLLDNEVLNIDWNALSGDAEGNNIPAESLLARTNETVGSKNNVVLLMHDAQAKGTTVEALPQIIAFFRDRGYEFVNFYEVIK